VAPRDRKSRLLLRGRYAGPEFDVQMVLPRTVVDDLVATMFSIRNAVLGVSLGLGLATLATATLVFALSIRLRGRELETMRRIGASRRWVRAILATEVLIVVVASGLIAAGLTFVVSRFGGSVLRLL